MTKYLAHVEYEVLYSGKRLHSTVEDVVVEPVSYCYVDNEPWHVVEFTFNICEHTKCSDDLELSAKIDICNENNQFIMHTHMKKKLKKVSIVDTEFISPSFKEFCQDVAVYETTIRMYVPVKENKNED
jgi:hypothetical protein